MESRQLHKEDYLQENRVELKGNVEVHSISSMSKEGRNNVDKYSDDLLSKILSRDNLNRAFLRVKANKGSHGIDGMKVDELLQYLKENGETLRKSLFMGRYNPKPVRRVEIPKPNGGIRLLGIPTVVDRVIQQAIAQILVSIYEKKFCDESYGFRPTRSAKQAIQRCKYYIDIGHEWVVDLDLAKYFDTINHDMLIRIISKDVKDGRVIALIRKYLKSGVMINGIVVSTETGAPQGGPLSPLLSNIMLHELDMELTKRKLRFVRYADDCNIYVKSKKAANRVMKSITRFIEGKLKLKVNENKSKVDNPWRLKFLGFSFYKIKGKCRIRVHENSVNRLKGKLKELTSRSNAMNIGYRLLKIKQAIIGWVNYFSVADMKGILQKLDAWIRRRMRMCFWKQWKRISTKYNNLIRLGVPKHKAWEYANTRKSYWRISKSPILDKALTKRYFEKLGLVSMTEIYLSKH